MNKVRFLALIKSMYRLVDEFHEMFEGRRFTPDGHMVGSLGEAYASYTYGIKLSAASAKIHDGVRGRKRVQIKATQGNAIGISSSPDHLLVLRLDRNGNFMEAYNGPGDRVWQLVSHKTLPSNGQFRVGLAALGHLMEKVPTRARIPRSVAEPAVAGGRGPRLRSKPRR